MLQRAGTAVGAPDLTRGVAAFGRGERDVKRRDFNRLARTAQWCAGTELFNFFLRLAAAYLQRSPVRTRRDRIYADAILAQLLSQRFGKGDDGRFSLRVIQQDIAWLIGLYRRGIDNGCAAGQVVNRRFGDPEHGVDVGFKSRVKVFGREGTDRLVELLTASVIYQNIESAQLLDSLLHQRLAKGFITDIARNSDGFTAFGFNQLDNFSCVRLFFWQIVNRNVCTFTGISDSNSAADTGIAAGDQRFASGQTAGAAILSKKLRQRVFLSAPT